MRRALILCLALALCSCSAHTEHAVWIGTWGAAPLPPIAPNGGAVDSRSFRDQTVRQILKISAGGQRVRFRLSNEYGDRPLLIGAAHVAIVGEDGKLASGSERAVTFGGRPDVTIQPGTPFVSDAIDLAVEPLATLSISLYFPMETGPCTCHWTGRQTAYVSRNGNFVSGMFEPSDTLQDRAFLSGVDVEVNEPARVVVVLGDSLTDGVGSMLNGNHRWPDYLAERLAMRDRGTAWGVVNAGVSGNRVLNDAAGQSALARFDRDVLAVSGVTDVFLSQGIDEIGIALGPHGPGISPPTATAESLIEGYKQLIVRAHAEGLKVFGATLTPFEDSGYYSDEGEAIRTAINRWIRQGAEFDAVFDFDAALRDPARPTYIKDGLHAGDHIHGNDDGYRRIADSIDLALFR